MPQSEQAVVGVFEVDDIVGPVAEEPAVGDPEGVDEIEVGVFDFREWKLDGVEGVEGDRSRKEVGHRGIREGEEAAFRMGAGS